MNDNYSTRFEKQLNQFSENQWLETLDKLSGEIHKVDQNATQIWFRFYPLSLFRYLQRAEDLEATLHGFAMQGTYQLKDQIDVSHKFLWGHRFWVDVKKAIIARADSFEAAEMDLADEIRMIAKSVANGVKQDASLLTGITAVGLMTLVQAELEEFKITSGDIAKPSGLLSKSPEKVLRFWV